MSWIRDSGIKLKAVESASASVAVGAMTLTVLYSDGLRPVEGSNRCVNRPLESNRKSSACRCRDRAIDEVNGFGERAGPVGIGEAHAPWRTFGPRSDRPYLAHIDQRRRQARAAQQIDDAVRGVSLRDAVQRDCRAAFDESDAIRTHKQAAAADLRQRFGQPLRRWPFRIGPVRREMIRIKLPQRLDCWIEGAVCQISKKQRGFQQRHHVGVGRDKNTSAVEGADRRVGPIQTELLLQPPHVQDTPHNKPFGLGSVRVINLDRHLRAERRSVPPHGIACLGRSATGQKCRPGCRRNDGDHAPARETSI